MTWLIDKATGICVGMMNWFGMFHNLVFYCENAKCDWNELAQARATVICVGKCTSLGFSRTCFCTLIRKNGIGMNWLIDNATLICVGKMHWFGIFQILVLYCQTVNCDWTDLSQDRATVKCVGQMHWFGMFQNLLLYSQTVKWDWNELAH